MNLYIDKIDNYEEPRKQIEQKMDFTRHAPEMTMPESAFLCGLIRKHRPEKIIEVGVWGGTSAVIMQCLHNLGIRAELHSVDFSEKYYKDSRMKSGFLGRKAHEFFKETDYRLYLGGVACSFMDEIGSGADFLVIDTMHILPGELLDIITLLPFLKDGCMVVLHDIAYGLYSDYPDGFATGLAMSSVTADKYINRDGQRKYRYPNIGAFAVSGETRENAGNLFCSLMVPWSYVPDNSQLESYWKTVRKYYPENLQELFREAVQINRDAVKRHQEYSRL